MVDSLALKINRDSIKLVCINEDVENIIQTYNNILMQDILYSVRINMNQGEYTVF